MCKAVSPTCGNCSIISSTDVKPGNAFVELSTAKAFAVKVAASAVPTQASKPTIAARYFSMGRHGGRPEASKESAWDDFFCQTAGGSAVGVRPDKRIGRCPTFCGFEHLFYPLRKRLGLP